MIKDERIHTYMRAQDVLIEMHDFIKQFRKKVVEMRKEIIDRQV